MRRAAEWGAPPRLEGVLKALGNGRFSHGYR